MEMTTTFTAKSLDSAIDEALVSAVARLDSDRSEWYSGTYCRLDHSKGILAKATESPEETIKKEPDDGSVDLEPRYGHKSSGDQHSWRSPQPLHIKMSVVARARLLLFEMSSGSGGSRAWQRERTSPGAIECRKRTASA